MTPEQGSQLLMGIVAKRFPEPLQVVFLDIEAEVGAKRKSDGTSLAYLQDRIAMYREIARVIGAIRIDGRLSVEHIEEVIRENVCHLLGRTDG